MLAALVAASVAWPLPLIDRPLTLPAGVFEGGLSADYSNWSSKTEDLQDTTLDGLSGVAGFSLGVAPGIQFGGLIALPLTPGFDFGSIAVDGVFALSPIAALRLDLGYEHVGLNGDNGSGSSIDHGNLIFGGAGVPLKAVIAPGIAVVSGHTGFQFAHFSNVGEDGAGFYTGASTLSLDSADLLTLVHSTDSGNDETVFHLYLPVGLLFQIAPPFAVTVSSGYHLIYESDNGNSTTTHLIPLQLDAVYSPSPAFDIGASFGLAGKVAGDGLNTGYADIRDLAIWIRVRSL